MSGTTVEINGEPRSIPPITGRKFVKLGKIIRDVTKTTPEILKAIGEFTAEFEAENQITMTRAQALMRFAPVAMMDEETGEPARDEQGELRMLPGRLEHLTDDDWNASNNQLTLPQSPNPMQTIAAVFPLAFDAAEESLVQLLGLMVIENRKLNEASREEGGVDAALEAEGQDLLDDAPFEDLIELVVVAFETVNTRYAAKAAKLGDRLGKILTAIGLEAPTATPTPEPSSTNSQPSSTASDPATDGPPITHSTESTTTSSTPALT